MSLTRDQRRAVRDRLEKMIGQRIPKYNLVRSERFGEKTVSGNELRLFVPNEKALRERRVQPGPVRPPVAPSELRQRQEMERRSLEQRQRDTQRSLQQQHEREMRQLPGNTSSEEIRRQQEEERRSLEEQQQRQRQLLQNWHQHEQMMRSAPSAPPPPEQRRYDFGRTPQPERRR